MHVNNSIVNVNKSYRGRLLLPLFLIAGVTAEGYSAGAVGCSAVMPEFICNCGGCPGYHHQNH